MELFDFLFLICCSVLLPLFHIFFLSVQYIASKLLNQFFSNIYSLIYA